MKKYVWIAALLAALAMIFAGCGGGGGTNTFTVKFNLNVPAGVTATPAAFDEKVVDEGKQVAKPSPDPVRSDSKAFLGWFRQPAATVEWKFASDTVTGDITLYAGWEGETGVPDIEAPAGFDAVALGLFTVENQATQKGWASNGYDGATTSVEVEDFLEAEYLWIWVENAPTGGMQIVWQGDGVGVNKSGWFQATALENTGDESTGVERSEEQSGFVIKIKLADVLATSTSGGDHANFTDAKAGIKFILGYYSTNLSSLGAMAAYLLLPEGTIEGRTYYTVTFNSDGGTAVANLSVYEDYPLGGKYPSPTKTDYVFDGWKDVNSTSYTVYTPITADTALTAAWLEECTVTFNYGATNLANLAIKIGKGKALGSLYYSPPSGTKNESGYVFAGWYEENTYTTQVTVATVINTVTVTFYAKWVDAAVITFNSDGGSVVSELIIPKNTPMGTDYPTPVKRGYSFGGWFDGATEYTSATNVTGDITLTAKWTEIPSFKLPLVLSNTQWTLNAGDTEKHQAAQYLVIEFTSVANENGFGGLQLAMQGDGNSWTWKEYISPDWTNCDELLDYGNPDDFFIVIKLSSMDDWDALIMGGNTQFFLNSVPSAITYKSAYLTNGVLTIPSGGASAAVELAASSGYVGWAQKADPYP